MGGIPCRNIFLPLWTTSAWLQEAEKRLKDLVSGKSKANGVLASNGLKKATSKRSPQNMLVFTVSCSLLSQSAPQPLILRLCLGCCSVLMKLDEHQNDG